jgi:hypothetical protein
MMDLYQAAVLSDATRGRLRRQPQKWEREVRDIAAERRAASRFLDIVRFGRSEKA